jgi:hypothetical protein
MYATRVIAGLIAGAAGAVAGLAAAAVVSFLLYGDWTFDPFPAPDVHRRYRLPMAAFVLVFLPVMAAVFKALERAGFVAGPPARRNTLGLTDRSVDPNEHDPRFDPHDADWR